MKIIIARHAEPDYIHDTITEKGKKEAALLAKRLSQIKIDEIYVSPLGRAKDTAAYTLQATGMQAQELDEVVLLGRSGDEQITMEELGELSGRFNYEFACCISKRVPRIYFKGGQVTE